MDEKLIIPFINATLNVLETMAFIKPEAETPYRKKDGVAQGDVSGEYPAFDIIHNISYIYVRCKRCHRGFKWPTNTLWQKNRC